MTKDRRPLINPPRIDEGTSGFSIEPQRYVIGWAEGVLKIGLTWNGKRRWGIFIGKGGHLLDLATYASKMDALDAEIWLAERVASMYPPAFESKEESRRYVGKAGGWTECFRVPAAHWRDIQELAES